jgi:23S rRNA (uracil1939-C5)-methyltransferase
LAPECEPQQPESFLVNVDSLSNQGEGVGRYQGKVVFVPYALPGERARVRIVESKKDYARARVERITRPSPDRVEPPCPHFGVCGGCQLQHAKYERALELKGQTFLETLERIGKVEVRLPPLVPSEPYGYRNKARFFATGRVDLPVGLKPAEDANDVLPIERCLIVSERIGYAYQETARCLAAEVSRGTRLPFSAMTFQEMETGLAVIVEGVPRDREFAGNWERVLRSVAEIRAAFLVRLRSRNRVAYDTLFGDKPWMHRLGQFDIPAAPGTFHQVNDMVGEKLYRTILGWIGKHWDLAVDLYCGTGTLAAELGRKFRRVWAADNNQPAITLAEEFYAQRKGSGLRFSAAPAEKFLFHQEVAKLKIDLLVLDPPRAGCSPRVMQGIAARRPRRIILVSCHPAAFARDVGKLVSSGYQVQDLRGFDMFPQTYHLEVAAVLGRV